MSARRISKFELNATRLHGGTSDNNKTLRKSLVSLTLISFGVMSDTSSADGANFLSVLCRETREPADGLCEEGAGANENS